MKSFTKLYTFALSSLLAMLGFGGCRSAKKAAKEETQASSDTLRVQPGQPTQIVAPDAPYQMRVLYGPPPARYRK